MRPDIGHAIVFRLQCEFCNQWTPEASCWDVPYYDEARTDERTFLMCDTCHAILFPAEDTVQYALFFSDVSTTERKKWARMTYGDYNRAIGLHASGNEADDTVIPALAQDVAIHRYQTAMLNMAAVGFRFELRPIK